MIETLERKYRAPAKYNNPPSELSVQMSGGGFVCSVDSVLISVSLSVR